MSVQRVGAALISQIRRFRYLPDRALHRRRREAARSQLAGIGRIQRILVVCSGNICRSPYLAAVLREKLPGVRVASAGFVGFNRPVPEFSLSVAALRGIDLTSFRSQTVEPRRARAADLVLVMEPRQAKYLASYYGVPRRRIITVGDLDSIVPPMRSIQDPYQQPRETFVATFDRLDRCARTLCKTLRLSESIFANTVLPLPRPAVRSGATTEHSPQPVS